MRLAVGGGAPAVWSLPCWLATGFLRRVVRPARERHRNNRRLDHKYERIDLLRPVRAQALGDVITVARVPWKQRISAFATEELEIAVSTVVLQLWPTAAGNLKRS